jgi:hypothetical protein
MRTDLTRLAAAVALILVLPPGWCCAASGGRCCGHVAVLGATPDTPAPTCSKCKACSGGCCCTKVEGRRPAPPQSPAQPAPARKADCCERQQVAAPKVELPTLDGFAAALEPPLLLTADLLAERFGVGVSPRCASPPLHLLHCVWLC